MPASYASGGAWEPRAADAPALHEHALAEIRALVARAAKAPEDAHAALLVGPAGAGKTHLSASLCQQVCGAAGELWFAEVAPVLDLARPLTHLQREIVGNLLLRPEGVACATQLDGLAARTIGGFMMTVGATMPELAAAARELRRSPEQLAEIVRPERYDWLTQKVCEWLVHARPRVWTQALRALYGFPLPARRELAAAWMRGDELDAGELDAVGIARDEVRDLEARAARTLATLGALLGYDRPLVTCFDHLEAYDTPERRTALAAQLAFLIDRMPGVVVVCVVRPERWNVLCTELPAPLIARFEQHRIELGPLPAGAVPAAPVGEGAAGALARLLDERVRAIAALPARFGPDAPALAEALRMLILVRDAVEMEAPRDVFRRASFVVRCGAQRIGVFVDAERPGRGTDSVLNAAAAALETGEAAGSIYVRDGRRAGSRETDDGMRAVTRAGGLVVDLDRDAAVAWHALAHLRAWVLAHAAGDEGHLTAWLRDRKPVQGAAEVLAYLEMRCRR